MEKQIVLIGGGGHCKVVIDALTSAKQYNIKGIIDSKLKKGTMVLNIPVLGNDGILEKTFESGVRNAFISVGSIGNCSVRRKIYDLVKNIGFELPVIIHPKAVVANDAVIGEGTFVAASGTINPGTKIGKNVIINTSSSVDHDCQIGDFVHIAPAATLSGQVKIGDGTHIGIGVNIVQGVSIGSNCMIKAGQLVCGDISNDTTYPSKRLSKKIK